MSIGPDNDTPGTARTVPGLRQDLAVLMKVRLNTFVLITTFFGYLVAARGGQFEIWKLANTLIGTACAAFGAAAFNQLMEVDLDARMKRTADRPLPARRMDPLVAFGVGWVLSAIGIIHLAAKVGHLPAYLAAATIGIYVFVYTPLKRFSSVNTLVGAVPGAIPPVIGWTAARGMMGGEAAFLFALLFFWQLPHFVAISWLCREEYESVGYCMWSNGDESGRRSGALATWFALALTLLAVWPWAGGFAGIWWLAGGLSLGLVTVALSWRFWRDGKRDSARRLFLFTLLYLPLSLGLLAFAWRAG